MHVCLLNNCRVVAVHVQSATGADRLPWQRPVHAVLLRCRVCSDGRRPSSRNTRRPRAVHDERSVWSLCTRSTCMMQRKRTMNNVPSLRVKSRQDTDSWTQ